QSLVSTPNLRSFPSSFMAWPHYIPAGIRWRSAGLGRRTSRLAHAHRLPLHSPRIIPQPPSDGQARHRADAGSPSLPEHVLQGNPVLLASVKLKGKSAQIPAMAGLDLGQDPLGPFLPLAERHGVEGEVIGLQDLVQGDQAVLG